MFREELPYMPEKLATGIVVWEKCMDWAIAQKQGAYSLNKGDNRYDLQEAIKVCESAEPKPLNP